MAPAGCIPEKAEEVRRPAAILANVPATTHKKEAFSERLRAALKTLDPQQRFQAVLSVAENRQEERSRMGSAQVSL
jgi:predicted aconitase with swiveling domain